MKSFFSSNFLKQMMESDFKSKILPKGWIDQAMHALSHVVPKEWSATALGQALTTTEGVRVNNNFFTQEQLILITRIFTQVNRSNIVAKQTESPRHNSAVPLILATYKVNHGVNYDKWDLGDSADRILGKAFTGYTAAQKAWEENKDSIDLSELRNYVDSDNYTKIKAFPFLKPFIPEKFFHMMLAQTWIFEPSVRGEDMVTSLEGLSVVAPAIESQFIVLEKGSNSFW